MFLACDCSSNGMKRCDANGQCQCKNGYTGSKCESCQSDYYKSSRKCLSKHFLHTGSPLIVYFKPLSLFVRFIVAFIVEFNMTLLKCHIGDKFGHSKFVNV